jgi:hypothetical protein
MSIDEPASGSGSRGERDDQTGTAGKVPGPSHYLRLGRAAVFTRPHRAPLPWRNLRRAVFLIVALMAVVALKRSAGGFFSRVLDSLASPTSVASPPAAAPAHTAPETTVHLQPGPPAK